MRLKPRIFLVTSFFLVACGSSDGTTSEPSGTDPTETPDGKTPGQTKTPGETENPGEEPVGPGGIIADLRADTNRDGAIKFDDAADNDGEDVWDKSHGAVFLANIDDDESSCTTSNVNDVDLEKCNDATDDEVNGSDDAEDLARLKTKPWADAPASASGTITFTSDEHVRLFKVKGTSFTKIESGAKLTAAEIKSGVELAIEGRDIVRDTSEWDGYVEITFKVTEGANNASDKVKMRVAPLLTYHHGLTAEQTYVSSFNDRGNQDMRTDLGEATSTAGVATTKTLQTGDPWTQDFFEPGFMSMPAAGGKQHVIRVAIRSANMYNNSQTNPLRTAGRLAFSAFRGKDGAAVQQWDKTRGGLHDTLNSFGNLETIPPYTKGNDSYPLGRVIRGNVPSFYPDKVFTKMMESQKVQPAVYVDTSWLAVGHIDETTSFVKASTPRGWKLLVNDATMAKTMLQNLSSQGYGSTSMFVGKYWDSNSPAQATINQVLSDTDIMSASAEAAAEVDAQVAIIREATGLTDAEIVRVPFLHMSTDGGHSIAYQPGMVNGIYISDTDFVSPDPHGPIINGVDPFKKAMEDALSPLGITAHFAEDWDTYHRNMGEVHCGTNTVRKIPDAKWWESGR